MYESNGQRQRDDEKLRLFGEKFLERFMNSYSTIAIEIKNNN